MIEGVSINMTDAKTVNWGARPSLHQIPVKYKSKLKKFTHRRESMFKIYISDWN